MPFCGLCCCGHGGRKRNKNRMSLKKFNDDLVSAHNKYRAKHGVAKLRHSKTLATEAQKWADYLASSGKFEHSKTVVKGEQVGENIAMKWSSGGDDYTGDQVADQWYSEIQKHDFKSEPRSTGTGHFTQMVWKKSEKVGFGKAKTKDNKVLVVGMYLPAGNFIGQFVENVPPPSAGGASVPAAKKDKGKEKKGKGRRGSHSSSSSSSSSNSSRESSPETKRKDKGSTNKTVKTTTTTENGVKVTKTVTTETIVGPDGSKKTVTREQVSREGPAGAMGDMDKKFGDMKMHGSGKPVKAQKMSDFIDDAVKAHNVYRSKHGVAPLKNNKDLSKTAQQWADHLAKTETLAHSTNTYKGDKLGENVASKWSSAGADYTGQEVVDQWYSEISKHDFKSEPKTLSSGHFTQVVWKASKEVGIGKTLTSSGKVFVVANYYPAGNFVSRFVENVMPLKK